MKCPSCKAENVSDAAVCTACGSKLGAHCPKCGNINSPASHFCSNCGCRLGGMEGAKREGRSTKSERKHVTVLFSDLSGYTAMTEKLDPEAVRKIMTRIFEKISLVIAKYDGFIERYIGDSVMAVFGIPKAHEDDPIRAIRAAMEIHQSVEAISPWVEEKIGQRLQMHMGINTGLAVVGEVNPEEGPCGLTGLTVNIASRLEGLSEPGEILVGQNTYTQAERRFHFEALEAVRVKGKSGLLHVYKVLSKKEKPPKRPSFHSLSFDFVGREKEMSEFKEKVEQLREFGRGGVISIIGDAVDYHANLTEF
jgi:class 3 adenylate cyclase